MTIRAAILRGFLALVFLAILLSGSLSYIEFRQALETEIAHNLGNSADSLLERIDVFFFERLEDLREWHRMELLQDIQVGDVDKRLARLLSDLKAGHGDVYSALYCTNMQDRIVAASDPGLIGRIRHPGSPAYRPRRDESAQVVMERAASDAPEGNGRMVLRTSVPNAFGTGDLGYLYAVLNWSLVERFLQDAVAGSERTALLLGENDQVIAAAGPLSPARQVAPLKMPRWYDTGGKTLTRRRSGGVLGANSLLVGAAASTGFQHFPGFGWHMLVVEPTSVAFTPIIRLSWAMLGGLLFSLAVASWLAVRLSTRIARPIGQVTEFARNFRQARTQAVPDVETGISEVSELSRAFREMIQALEHSREHLVRASKLAVVGEMAAIMAHEVRTPLGILKSSAQMLERRPNLPSQDRELTGFIVNETERLNRLVTTLLESTSPRPPLFQDHDLHEIISHVLALVGSKLEKSALQVETQLHARPSILSCDREQIIQVLLNLIINAIQHAPEGGRIRLVTRNETPGISVRVEDDGPGVPEQDQRRIFDPFYTLRKGGIGLGLTIVQQIVQAHGGRIEVSRSMLGGACFTLYLAGSARGA
ncbi:MAG TPA: ATP-binding protein [Thiobacillaceae bacterium]|nr:ATP-binding protein [Thiobacillaceae bacterium]